MTALPKSISTWTELLSCFPHDIKSIITSFVNQLTPLINNIAMVQEQDQIEPDGFNGVGRSAHYERLLLSEWALHDHHPDEFIRRAVSSEHLFHEVKQIEHKENRTCFVLFDCGPEQLGKPRIVQLAILLLLARRASKNGAIFQWGVIQDKNQKLYEGVSKECILQWLQQRSVSLATQPLLDNWIEHFMQSFNGDNSENNVKSRHANNFLDDFWLISKSNISKSNCPLKQVRIIEPLLNPELIDVEIDSEKNKRQISLKVNQESVNVKIIRNPFSEKQSAPLSGNWCASDSWVVSRDGKRIAFKDQDNNIGIYTINVSNRKKIQEKAVFRTPKGQNILGVHLTKKRSVILCSDRDFFYFHNYPYPEQIKKIDKKQAIRIDGKNSSISKAVLYRDENGSEKFLILDTQNKLRQINLTNNESKPLFSTLGDNVLSLGSLLNCDYYIEHNRSHSSITINWYLGAYNSCRKTLDIQGQLQNPRFFIHGGGPWFKGSIGCFAYETDHNTWRLISGQQNEIITTDDGDYVVGILTLSNNVNANSIHARNKKIALVVVKQDLKSVYAISESGESPFIELRSEFRLGDINPRHPFLHYINSHNELVVVDLLKDTELLRLANNGASNAQL